MKRLGNYILSLAPGFFCVGASFSVVKMTPWDFLQKQLRAPRSVAAHNLMRNCITGPFNKSIYRHDPNQSPRSPCLPGTPPKGVGGTQLLT
jgi:hypothetical protein